MPTAAAHAEMPAGLLHVATLVEDRLEAIFEREIGRWQQLTPDLVEPIAALRQLVMAGGKRLRPAFCFWGFVGAGGESDDGRVIDAGAAFELLQAFALVHDDIMDGSSVRRGFRTAHLAFSDRHTESIWRGEDRRFGEGVGILIGDLAHVYADMLMREAGPGVGPVWDELRIELNVGQYLDILGTARGDRDIEAARRIARYKSGKYTIERPLHIGAALAERRDLQPSLSAYGDPLGEAFQLRDDMLGAFGDPLATGKPVGDDLREGKPTPLLAVATQSASDAERQVLDRVGRADLAVDDVHAIQQVLEDTGARDEIEADIRRLTGTAIDGIGGADVTDEARDALIELAHFVAARRS